MADYPQELGAKLIIINEKMGESEEFDLIWKSVTLGSDQRNDIVITSNSVSRHHARIAFKDGEFVIYALKKSRGLFLDGQRFSKKILKDGDIISLGNSEIKLKYYENSHIESPSDTEEGTSERIAGFPQKLTLRNAPHLIAHQQPASYIAEAFRSLRTNLILSKADPSQNTFLITSADPSAGKSTIVSNLGIVLARTGKQVIIVDSDMRRPVLHRAFNIPRRPGLTNVLAEDFPLDEVLKKTGIKDLHFLPSGSKSPNPSELLQSDRMKSLIEQLRERADFILFDSPPILSISDALILSVEVDGVILVLDVERVPRDMAQHVEKSLKDAGAKILGVVLNKVIPTRSSGYYYYYHRYYDSYYKD